jgi:hypothetical protein
LAAADADGKEFENKRETAVGTGCGVWVGRFVSSFFLCLFFLLEVSRSELMDWRSVCIVSILRLALVHHAAEKRNVTGTSFHRAFLPRNYVELILFIEAGTHVLIWSTTEVNVALICASLFVMKPLFMRFFPKLVIDSRPQSAVEDAKGFRRWVAVETLRDTLNLEDLEGCDGVFGWRDLERGESGGSGVSGGDGKGKGDDG